MDIGDLIGDAKLEGEGAWVLVGTDGFEIKVARLQNPKMQRLYAQRNRQHGRRLERDPDLQNAVYIEVLAKTVLLDWRGLTHNKKEVKFSQQAAIDLMTRSVDFRNMVTRAADDVENFKSAETEADEKNSPKSSTGT